MTQEGLAKLLGVGRVRVNQIESGSSSVSELLLIRLADALAMRPSELVALGEPEFEPGSLAQIFQDEEKA